jgi:hypothetical protein
MEAYIYHAAIIFDINNSGKNVNNTGPGLRRMGPKIVQTPSHVCPNERIIEGVRFMIN